MLYRGTVVDVIGNKVYAKVPRRAGDIPLGPFDHPGFTLEAGTKVLLGQVGNIKDNLAIVAPIGAVEAGDESIAWEDITGKPNSITSIGSLTPANNTIPYYTGASTAALTPFTSEARQLLDDTSFSAMRTTLGLGNVPNVDATLRSNHTGTQLAATISNFSTATIAVIASVAGVATGLATLNGSTKHTTSEIPLGTVVQAWSAKLDTYAGQTWAADQISYQTGTTTLSTTPLTSFIRTLLDDANQAAAQTTLGITPAGSAQPLDSDLTAIAGLTPTNDDMIQRKAGAWTNRTMAQLKTDLVLVKADVGLGNVTNDAQLKIASNFSDLGNAATARTNLGVEIGVNVQAFDADLTTIAGLTATTGNMIQSVGSAWASRTPAQVRTDLGLVVGTNVQAWDADLDTIAGLTATTGNMIQSVGSAWASRTPAQVRTDLALVIGTNVQAWDADLDTYATKTPPSGAVVGTTDTQTLTAKRITPRANAVIPGATVTPASDTSDQTNATALNQATTIAAPSGTPTDGQKLTLRIKDNGTARALTWNAIYRAIGVTLPTTTVISKLLYVGMIFNSADTKWDVIAVAQEA